MQFCPDLLRCVRLNCCSQSIHADRRFLLSVSQTWRIAVPEEVISNSQLLQLPLANINATDATCFAGETPYL